MCDCSFTNNISLICQNPRVTAINTCLEIDLTGQVCADSIGPLIYTGEKCLIYTGEKCFEYLLLFAMIQCQ
jgi:hypothetical protein